MGRSTRYSPSYRAEAVATLRQVRPQHSSEWAAIQAVAATLGISAETLRTWVRRAEPVTGHGRTDAARHQAEIRRLSREISQLRRALDLLRTDTRGSSATTATPDPA